MIKNNESESSPKNATPKQAEKEYCFADGVTVLASSKKEAEEKFVKLNLK